MPHIKKFTVYFEDTKYHLSIKYSARSKRFEVKLPDPVGSLVGDTLNADSLDAIEKKIHAAIEKAAKMKTTDTKVIIFMFDFKGNRYDEQKKKVILEDQDTYSDFDKKDLEIEFWWHIAMERTYGKEKNWYLQYAADEDKGKDEWNFRLSVYPDDENLRVIPWTQERENFFQNIDDGFVQLILRLKTFMWDKPKQIATLIDGGAIPLLTAGNPERKHNA